MLWVQDTDQQQTDAIADGVQPYDPSIPVSLFNYFNNNTQLVNDNTFGPLRVAYFVKEGPICTLNFQAEYRISGSQLIDPPVQESNSNNDIGANGQPISYIDSAIMQHDTKPQVPNQPSVFPQYAVTELLRDQLFALTYTQYDLDAFKINIIDVTVNKLVMFNIQLKQKGFIETKQHPFRLCHGW
ncbi:MAG: hypothetical protein EZS28_027968 [Streblomastix strix]|uniref:Uncharacterized protein n=1 Tax=Streblomastix strix TaxID=222440 RepID=A0A5J4V0J8_9EUKA|nr:MAG: hypothetical protein EZS28_027968 [Streblomastix strix]